MNLIKRASSFFISSISFCLIFLLIQCKQAPTELYVAVQVSGKTMGTTYNIKFDAIEEYLNHQFEIDSVLVDVNDALSHYIPTSVISKFNAADSIFVLRKVTDISRERLLNGYFMTNYQKSKEIWKLTKGAFDPTVGPLVNFWGFGTDGKKEIGVADTAEVAAILQLVGLDQIQFEETMAAYRFIKKQPGIKLDFSAIAKGFGIDEVCKLLEARGIGNYMVEIGGEVRCKGLNPSGNEWRIGISRPDDNAILNSFFATLDLSEDAMASSGNYRNFYIRDGIKRFHSINPKTGFPEENRMRSATILTTDCMTADALATACMVLGVEKAKSLAYTIDNVNAFLIYESQDGNFEYFATTGVNFDLAQ